MGKEGERAGEGKRLSCGAVHDCLSHPTLSPSVSQRRRTEAVKIRLGIKRH